MRTQLATASAIALGLALAGPAAGQDATGQLMQDPPGGATDLDAEGPDADAGTLDAEDPALATDPMPDSDEPGVATDAEIDDAPDMAVDPETDFIDSDVADDTVAAPERAIAAERLGVDEMHDLLGEVGIEERELFFGQILRGETDDGHPVTLLVGPADFEPGEGDAEDFVEFGEVHASLSDAGFRNVQQDIDWIVMQGRLDGQSVFAMEARQPGADQEAEAEGDIDADALRDKLADAGFEGEEELDAQLYRAATADGATIFLLVGPQGFEAGGEVALSEDESRERLEEAGLSEVERVEDDVHLVRADYEGSAVLALAGRGLEE